MSGRCVRDLADGMFEAGRHRLDLSASGLSTGIYFRRMKAEQFSATRRLVLLE